jgi:hypothetical protein
VTIVNLLKEKLGEQYKLSAAAIDLVLKLSHEFVYKLADEANNQCMGKDKKTLNHTHVLSALTAHQLAHCIGARHRQLHRRTRVHVRVRDRGERRKPPLQP